MRPLSLVLGVVLLGCNAEPVAEPPEQERSARLSAPRTETYGPQPWWRQPGGGVVGSATGGRRGNDFTYRIPRPQHPDDPVLNPTLPPVLSKRIEPELTQEARRARISGFVVLEIVIERDGRVSGGQVLKALPMGLTQKAIDAVRQWEYEPAVHEGLPVRTKQIVKVAFRPETAHSAR